MGIPADGSDVSADFTMGLDLVNEHNWRPGDGQVVRRKLGLRPCWTREVRCRSKGWAFKDPM